MTQDPPLSPTASGHLSTASLPELLVLSLERRANGSFVFTAPTQRESALVVASGRVIKVRPAEPVEPLGRLLAEVRALEPGTLALALDLAQQRRGRLGEALLQLEAVDRDTLERALREQLGRRLTRLGRLPEESAFAFYADIDLLDDEPACGADPLSLIWRCLREGGAAEPRQRALLAGLADRPLTLRPRGALERLDISPRERAWLDVLRAGSLPLEALLAAAGELDAAAARRLVYGLVVTRQLVVATTSGTQPPTRAGEARDAQRESPAPAASSGPAPRAAAATTSCPPGVPPAPLGEPRNPRRVSAEPGAVPNPKGPTWPGSGHEALAASFPPPAPALLESHSPAPSTSSVGSRKPRSASAVAVPSRSSTLPAPPSSASGARRLAGDSERVEHALERASRLVRERARAEGAADAARAIEAAQACITRNQFAQAEPLARRACERDPNNPEYLALHAWLRMQNGELTVPAQAAQILSALDRAAIKAPASVTIRFYRAQALKRLGRDEEAYRDFRFVARRAPEYIDAVREVRLHMMRSRNEQKQSGVFSKLFVR